MDRSERVRDLFARAVVLPTPDRAAFLDEQCADDPSLRRDVERLLSFDHAEDATGAPFARPVESVARALAALSPGEVISNRFRIVRLLGEGGMGAVYEATQLVPIERAVALKIIKPGMDSTRVLQRFEAERQALALMDHASIARVLDAGIAEDGRPFFVMELVDGIPIDRYCDEHRLDMHARLALFVDVCQAVQHAHQKGIIHRDLKPSNILVAEQDGRAVPKVIDFGIAKAVECKLTDQTLVTEMGLFIGTPEYMSPEQAGGSDVDTRSDIYALGVLLYQLLTGTTPFERSELQRLGFEEILRIIREVEPPRPSTRVAESTTAAGQGSRTSDTATLRRHLRGDLDWIIMRALAKDRRRRYESAHALAVDIRRHVAHEPVSAGPPSAAYHISKFARRHVIVLTASIVVALTLIAATIVSVRFAVDANTARAAEAARAEEANRARTAAQRSAYKARLAAADAAYLDLDVVAAADHLEAVDERFKSTFEWRVKHGRLDQSLAAFRPPGSVPESGAGAGRTPDASMVHALDVSPSGIVASGAQDGLVRLFDPDSGEVLRTLEHASSVLTVVFDATGERLAVAADDDGAVIWDLTDPPRRLDLGTHAGGCATVALAPSGTRLASAGADAVVVIRDIATGTVLQTLAGHDEGVIWRVAFSPDGTRLASASDDGTARIWSLVAPDETIVIDGHDDAVKWVAFDETGEHLVTTSRDTTVRTWDARTGAPERTFAGHLSKVSSAVFSADGTRILSAGNDGTLRIWEAATGAPLAVMTGHTFFTFPAVYALDGRHIFSASYDGTVRKWHASAGDELLRLPGHDRQCDDLAFSPDGSLLLTTTVRANGGDVLLWDAATSSLLARIPTPGGIRAGAFAPNGEWIAVNGGEQVTRLYDTRTGELLRVLAQSGGTLFAVAINPAGTQLATGARNGSIDLWSVPDGMLTRTIEAHERDVVSLAYSPDGRLASGGRDNAVHLWDPSTGTRLASAADHTWFVSEVAFTRDGAALLTAGLDGKVFLRDPVTLVAQGEPLAHREPIFQIGASPDGTRLVVGRNQGAPVVWDLSSREIITTLNELGIASASVAFGPAGHRVAVGTVGRVHLWDAAPMTERLDAHAERMRLATIVEPLVARTLANAPNALAAHAALASDTTLEPAARRVAMQLLLEHATRPPE